MADTNHIAKRRKELDTLLTELEAGQKEMEKGPIEQSRGDELEAKAQEAESIQNEIDQYERLVKMRRTPKDPVLPNRNQPDDDDDPDDAGEKIVGTMSLGDAFVRSPQFRDFMKNGAPRQASEAFGHRSLYERVRVRKSQVKTIPDIGEDVLIPMRDPDLVRIPEREDLRVRDILGSSTTSAAAVSYIVYRYGEAAAPVAETDVKPEAEMGFASALAPVRTIAVWIPVTEQQLEDLPALSGLINTDLTYDVRHEEDGQLLYGDGTGENLLGLLDPATGVPEIPNPAPGRTPENLIEQVRMGITDVTLRGGSPNAAVMHPIDFEAAELTKGTDGHYLWAVVNTAGVRRFWSLTVVESTSLMDDAGERTLVVGDFLRGATIWDRRQVGVSVGWINDQFIRNMRTIRAEERLAYATKRPHFFARAVPLSALGEET